MIADPLFSRGPDRRRGSFPQGSIFLFLLVVVPAVAATVQGFDETSTAPPPIVLTAGDDLAAAQARGLITQGSEDQAPGGTDLQLHVPVGARVTIDHLLEVHASDEVEGYEMALGQASVAPGASGTGVALRLWTGQVAPQADDDPQVCQVLALDGPTPPVSGGCDAAVVHVQLIVEVPEGQQAPGLVHLVATGWLQG